MKTMKLWRIAFVMLAAFSIASFLCVTPQQLSRIRKAVTFWRNNSKYSLNP